MTTLAAQNDYLTTSEASQFLQVTRFTVLNWIKQGKLQAITTLGGHQRIPKEVLTSFIQKTQSLNQVETKSKEKEPVICCWESKEIKLSGEHNCARCLVFKSKANRCFLSIRSFGPMKVECKSDCLNCEYFAKYYPEERKTMEALCAQETAGAGTRVMARKKVVTGGLLNKISYGSGKCIATITHKFSKPRSRMLKKDVAKTIKNGRN
jgi:excisionase family DNA binding protein